MERSAWPMITRLLRWTGPPTPRRRVLPPFKLPWLPLMASSRLTIRWWTHTRARQVSLLRTRARISHQLVLESLRAHTTQLMPPTKSSSRLLTSRPSLVQEVTPLKLRGPHHPTSSGLTLSMRHKISANPIAASQRSLGGTAISRDGSKISPSIRTFLMASPLWSVSWDKRITR